MLEGFQDGFREEAYELLNTLEQSLLELENHPHDTDVIGAVFRTMHTIKGSAAMFGFETISEFTHHVESMLDDVRSGALNVESALIDFVLQCRDHIRHMLDEPDDPRIGEQSKQLLSQMELLVAQIRSRANPPNVYDQPLRTRAIGGDASGLEAETRGDQPEHLNVHGDGLPRTFHIRFQPHPEMLRGGANPILLLTELHELGECTVLPQLGTIPSLDEVDPERVYVSWDVFLTTTAPLQTVQDVFVFVTDQCDLRIRMVDEIEPESDADYKRLGQILVDRGVVPSEVVTEAIGEQRRLGELLSGHGVAQQEIESALKEQEHVRRTRQKAQTEALGNTLRVPSEKLDELVDLVGELVTLQARLSQTIAAVTLGVEGTDAVMLTENLERLIGALRDHTMSIRMVPMAATFGRFKRLVRDLSQELGKEVELITEGGETELDKTVIDRLHDPLVHIIRNSIDHGIERPAKRTALGKPAAGVLRLEARHVGANVVVAVRDDGAGLNRERILARARERGLLAPDAQPSDQEIDELIFHPGFSTAEQVTAVSGRGVGMDVVKRELEAIGGSAAVVSTPGVGSTVTLTIPLTLAIIDGLLVQVGPERFVIPLTNVEECIEYYGSNEARGVVKNRGALLPVIDLRSDFGISGAPPDIQQAVVVQSAIGSVGIIVDAVIGDHQTVIKNLGRLYQHIEGISGATIMGDGNVALIIDVQRLVSGTLHGARHA